MESKTRKLLLALSILLALPAALRAQDSLSVKRVSSTQLVEFLKSELGEKVYFQKDPQDVASYTIASLRTRFTEAAMDELQKSGYSVARYEGSYFVTTEKSLAFNSLPTGFFDVQKPGVRQDELSSLYSEESVLATFRNKIYEIGEKGNSTGGKAYIRGTVRDITTGEPLVGVSVFDEKNTAYTATDAYGFYRIALPVGENTLCLSGYSLEDMKLSVRLYGDGGLDVVMKEKVTSLKGAIVSAESRFTHRDAKMGLEKVRINTIKHVPVAFGEADVLKVVLTLPGVKSVGEAASGFNVRGGATDQNLILFNDGTIFNPSHMFGVLSAFNADVINDVELYKSSIPAEFGGRISSVLDIRGKEGNANKIAGTLGLGLLTSNFTLEGPLVKGKTTFVLGGRTTYSDWMLKALPENSSYSGGSAGFSDLNLGITHKVNDNNTLHAYAYWSRDKFAFSGDTTFRYRNLNVSLKWRKHISDHMSMTASAGYDRYVSSLEDSHYALQAYTMNTGIQQGFFKLQFNRNSDSHSINYGLNAIYYDLNPGYTAPLNSESMIVPQTLDKQNAADLALYVGDTWSPNSKLSFDYGVRASGFMALNPSKFFFNPEFRLSGKYSFRDNFSFKAGFNSMSQNLHMISNNTSVSPVDTWRLSNSRLRPQTGWQGAGGFYWTIADNAVELSLEGYYKNTYHYLDYKSGAVLTMNPTVEDDLVETTGKSYGVEFMARKELGKLNGWISYSYSRAFLRETEDRGINTINGGDWYNAPYDKPHDFKFVLNYKFTHRYSFSTNLEYSTGRPVTIPVGKYWYANTYVLAYSERNAYRIPDYFRLDVALNIEPGHYLKQFAHMSFTLGVYNVTGRKNAYSVYYTSNNGLSVNGYMLSVFATQIPYINLNLKF